MLLLEHLDHLAATAAQAISNSKFDKVVVWEGGASAGQGGAAGFLQSLARAMPPMMQILKDIGGVEVPEYLARLTPEAKDRNGKEVVTPAQGLTVAFSGLLTRYGAVPRA